ncbi:MAG: hypothetical protein CM1200mP4_4520 [Rhodospirillaceae bacterium]|nr:MAG: hypothetical protein CM1200mP4_4520 [Rhodospirillaceae bacterium]
MDIKITGITEEVMEAALSQARDGRMHILGEMSKSIDSSRETVNEHAPRITTITIPKDKIREVIGQGGKVIREITEETGTKKDIDDEGKSKLQHQLRSQCSGARLDKGHSCRARGRGGVRRKSG